MKTTLKQLYSEADVKLMEVMHRVENERNMKAVEALGEQIGYGNLMSWASALWRRKLKECGLPENGAFVPRCTDKLSDDELLYDEWVYDFKKQVLVNNCILETSNSSEICFIIRNNKELTDILFILAENKYSWAGSSYRKKLSEGPIYLLIDKPNKVAICIDKRPRHVLRLYNAQEFNQESLGIAISDKFEAKGGE